jgi:hypothetical protein
MSAAATATHRASIPTLDSSPQHIREVLERSDHWAAFDILELERLTEKRSVHTWI